MGYRVTIIEDEKDIVDLVRYNFRKEGFEPEGYTLSTYAAIQVWAEAANKAKTTDSEKVAAMMRSQDWDTVIGKLGFDAKGDLKKATYVWYVFKNGTYSELKM